MLTNSDAVPGASGAMPALARLDCDINHLIAYGQSLSVGYEGWPALSVIQPHDSLMLGGSVRPRRENAPRWQPVGDAAFRPLVAGVQNRVTGEMLTRDEVAALPQGDIALGETVLEAAANSLRGRILASGAHPGQHRLLASTCGVGGRTLEALSRGADPDLFNRLRDCAALACRMAGEQGLSYGIAAFLFLQGESNLRGWDGGTSGYDSYLALLRGLHRDIQHDITAGIARQANAPAWFLYQTGGIYATETNTIPQAQLDFALSTPGCFLAAPSYPVTDKNGHLDANGYRWLGEQFGKVMYRVLVQGQPWRPLHPLMAECAGRQLHVRFHVPAGPLAWGQPMLGHKFANLQDRGFRLSDARSLVPLRAVELNGPDTVVLTLARDPDGPLTLRYAATRGNGRGMLRDSDPEPAASIYEYTPGTGHYETANIPELTGRPYPLHNWCVAFTLAVSSRPAAPPPPLPAVPVLPPAPIAAPPPASPPQATRTPAWDALRSASQSTPQTEPAPPPPKSRWRLFGKE